MAMPIPSHNSEGIRLTPHERRDRLTRQWEEAQERAKSDGGEAMLRVNSDPKMFLVRITKRPNTHLENDHS